MSMMTTTAVSTFRLMLHSGGHSEAVSGFYLWHWVWLSARYEKLWI